MRSILFFFIFSLISVCGFCQYGNVQNGPLPYKTLKETIGQTYVLLPLLHFDEKTGYNTFYKEKDDTFRFSAKEGAGKKFKLVSISDDKVAHFVDSTGTEFKSRLVNKTYMFSLALVSDIEDTRKLLLNKTVWLNNTEYISGDPFALPFKVIKLTRFDPVTVTDVTPGCYNDAPVIITFKTAKGETFSRMVSASGTNSSPLADLPFDKYFFTENPKLKYHFTPAVWKLVQNGWIEIGMPLDAFILSEGTPTHVNTTKTGNTSRVQLVYGETSPTYYYFVNGKYTSKN